MARARCGSCGTCERCMRAAYMRDWYKRNAAKARESARRSRLRRIEQTREYDRQRGFRGKPEQTKARNAARSIPRELCEITGCGNLGERHHDDYSKPLVVRFLCRTHHAIEHRRVA